MALVRRGGPWSGEVRAAMPVRYGKRELGPARCGVVWYGAEMPGVERIGGVRRGGPMRGRAWCGWPRRGVVRLGMEVWKCLSRYL